MTTRVKICGLTRPEDVEASILYGASFLGFIVEAKSSRRLSVSRAASLARPAKPIAPRVAVTVNADDALLRAIMTEMQPDYIQCHGDEDVARVVDIAKTFRVKTIKAVPVATDDDMKTAAEFSGVADLVLIDAKPPKGSDVRGGHGLSFDWNIVARAPRAKQFVLAGGLTPQNVVQAIATTRAPIVDVASGVEAAPGVKDRDKIRDFMKAVQNG